MTIATTTDVEILKLDFESVADQRRREGHTKAASTFDRLAATVHQIDVTTLSQYCELFDDLPDVKIYNALMEQVGFGWSPASAAEFVQRFIAEASRSSN